MFERCGGRLGGAAAATECDHARLDELDEAVRADQLLEVEERVGLARGLNGDRLGRHVHDLGAEDLDELDKLIEEATVLPTMDSFRALL